MLAGSLNKMSNSKKIIQQLSKLIDIFEPQKNVKLKEIPPITHSKEKVGNFAMNPTIKIISTKLRNLSK